MSCPGHGRRHWFAYYGQPGSSSPTCVRGCGARNPNYQAEHDPRQEDPMARTFQARYPGRCAADCGERIEVGQDVGYVGDDLVHADCGRESLAVLDRLGARTRPEKACPSCFLVHAGECM